MPFCGPPTSTGRSPLADARAANGAFRGKRERLRGQTAPRTAGARFWLAEESGGFATPRGR
eukprot:11185760-Lingulodinium_polyedra.AAC.1